MLKTQRKSRGGEDVFTVSSPTGKEHWISVAGSDAASLSKSAAMELKRLSAFPVARFVFSGTSKFASFGSHDSQPECGVSWLQGDACNDGDTTSMQVFAISGEKPEPVVFKGRRLGFVYETECAKFCRLCSVAPQNVKASGYEQAKEAFETLGACLEQSGFVFTDTVRTWLYLNRLLAWYKDFNKARTEFFERAGIFSKMVPASTGIGAASQHGSALVCDLLAMKPKNSSASVREIPSPLQSSAMDYKSSFSRAVELSFPTHRQVMISGSASIDLAGKSANVGDVPKQIDLTMRVLHAILESRGMDWQDVSRGIAYFKDFNSRPLLDAYCRKNGIPSLPLAPAHTDICRDDLLFEVELDAIKEV